jgi:ubiquitin fusion degradation protein 1
MQTLLLEPGDLLQIKSTDLPPGTFIKLQPQSVAFLEISDPKAVLENAMRNFSCLTKGDVFSFSYNDSIYSIEVLETKPGGEGTKSAISVLETDLEVDFAPPVGYVEPSRSISGTSTPRSMGTGASTLRGESGMLHNTGTMAQAINYSSIAPSANSAAKGSRAAGSNFLTAGQKLSSKKGAKPLTPKASTPVAGASTNKAEDAAHPRRKTNGPQPLRLPPGKLFFGYEIKPVKGKNGDPTAAGTTEEQQTKESRFAGQGMSLRPGGIKRKGDGGGEMDIDSKPPAPPPPPSAPGGERKGGRTLRDLS